MRNRRGGVIDKIRTGVKVGTGLYAAYQAARIGYGLYKLHGKLNADKKARAANKEFNDRKSAQSAQKKVYI